MKQLGEDQLNYEKYIHIFGDQKYSARHSASFLLLLQIIVTQWKMKRKANTIKKK